MPMGTLILLASDSVPSSADAQPVGGADRTAAMFHDDPTVRNSKAQPAPSVGASVTEHANTSPVLSHTP